MIPLRDIASVVRDTLTDWQRLRWDDLQFDRLWTAVLLLLVIFAICALTLLARGLRSQTAGRTHIALPALVPVVRRAHLSALRHAAFFVFLSGIPFFAVALADPHTAFTREERSYPGRRIALLVDGSGSMIMKFNGTTKLKTPENATFYTAVAAANYFMTLRRSGRYHDLVALVQFGNEGYVVTPFTTDYDNVALSLSLIGSPREWNAFTDAGTTILQGMNDAINLFKTFDFVNASGNLMLMFTDGRDDEKSLKGRTVDEVVAEMQKRKIPLYLIRTGYNLKEGQLDTDRLWRSIVEQTGGHFYAGDSENAILRAESEIDKLSAGRIDVREYTSQRPRFDGYVLVAVGLWLSAGVMKLGFRSFRTFP